MVPEKESRNLFTAKKRANGGIPVRSLICLLKIYFNLAIFYRHCVFLNLEWITNIAKNLQIKKDFDIS